MELFQSENIIFLSAIFLVLALGVIEALTVFLVGTSTTSAFDFETDISTNHSFEIFSWLNKGKLLLMSWLILFLTIFGLSGLVIQNISFDILGYLSPGWLVSIPAIIIGLISMRMLSPIAARLMIKDETTAISPKLFIGEVATIVIGSTTKGKQTEAKFTDRFGQTHYFQVEPISENIVISKGEKALIVGMYEDKIRVFAVVKDFDNELINSTKEKETIYVSNQSNIQIENKIIEAEQNIINYVLNIDSESAFDEIENNFKIYGSENFITFAKNRFELYKDDFKEIAEIRELLSITNEVNFNINNWCFLLQQEGWRIKME